jgi:hypothetical protein
MAGTACTSVSTPPTSLGENNGGIMTAGREHCMIHRDKWTTSPYKQQKVIVSPEKEEQEEMEEKEKKKEENPSIDRLAGLIQDIASCGETFEEIPARALRILFTLSEDHVLHEINRIRMVREANSGLVPTILNFLHKCEPNSSEQYLALLVLNNLSIPSENKRIVAIDCNGGKILSKMLCKNPESSLVCIILVNLCFCDANLRSQLLKKSSEIFLMEAFTYALLVSDKETEAL